jgi:hypothetical protein
MKSSSADSSFIDQKIAELGDWRGQTLAKVRAVIRQADPEVIEERKWVKANSSGTPVFSHAGIICTAETYKAAVKLTFAKGASLPDPSRLFNSSLEGNVRRAIDIHEHESINKTALQKLFRAAVALNLKSKIGSKTGSKAAPSRGASSGQTRKPKLKPSRSRS